MNRGESGTFPPHIITTPCSGAVNNPTISFDWQIPHHQHRKLFDFPQFFIIESTKFHTTQEECICRRGWEGDKRKRVPLCLKMNAQNQAG